MVLTDRLSRSNSAGYTEASVSKCFVTLLPELTDVASQRNPSDGVKRCVGQPAVPVGMSLIDAELGGPGSAELRSAFGGGVRLRLHNSIGRGASIVIRFWLSVPPLPNPTLSPTVCAERAEYWKNRCELG